MRPGLWSTKIFFSKKFLWMISILYWFHILLKMMHFLTSYVLTWLKFTLNDNICHLMSRRTLTNMDFVSIWNFCILPLCCFKIGLLNFENLPPPQSVKKKDIYFKSDDKLYCIFKRFRVRSMNSSHFFKNQSSNIKQICFLLFTSGLRNSWIKFSSYCQAQSSPSFSFG